MNKLLELSSKFHKLTDAEEDEAKELVHKYSKDMSKICGKKNHIYDAVQAVLMYIFGMGFGDISSTKKIFSVGFMLGAEYAREETNNEDN